MMPVYILKLKTQNPGFPLCWSEIVKLEKREKGFTSMSRLKDKEWVWPVKKREGVDEE
jgi:hypothetical protein